MSCMRLGRPVCVVSACCIMLVDFDPYTFRLTMSCFFLWLILVVVCYRSGRARLTSGLSSVSTSGSVSDESSSLNMPISPRAVFRLSITSLYSFWVSRALPFRFIASSVRIPLLFSVVASVVVNPISGTRRCSFLTNSNLIGDIAVTPSCVCR